MVHEVAKIGTSGHEFSYLYDIIHSTYRWQKVLHGVGKIRTLRIDFWDIYVPKKYIGT